MGTCGDHVSVHRFFFGLVWDKCSIRVFLVFLGNYLLCWKFLCWGLVLLLCLLGSADSKDGFGSVSRSQALVSTFGHLELVIIFDIHIILRFVRVFSGSFIHGFSFF